MNANHTVDLLIVGSGNGALTAALCAYEFGVRDVLVVEKTAQYGGTSATSGGGIWIPCNRYAREAGAEDSLDAAREYLRATIPAGLVPPALLETYVVQGPRMLDFLHERTRVRYESLAHYPDYWSFLPGARGGHRSLEPAPLRSDVLGKSAAQLRALHHMMWLADRIPIKQVEAQVLMAQLPGWRSLAGNLLWEYVSDLGWWLRHKRSRRLTNGSAGVARLRWSMLDRGLPLWLETAFQSLVVQNGRVVGALVQRGAQKSLIHVRRGVILAAGGFEHNQAMREQYLPKPTRTEWSAALASNTGDAVRAGLEIGADVRLMDGAWWCSTMRAPDDPVPRLAIMEKSYPGNCVVNRRGARIANESQNYMGYQHEFFRRHSEADPQVPSWMVFDARFRRTYYAGPLWPSRYKPDWMVPKTYFSSGFLTKADSIRELAQRAGIDPSGLERTIAAMNEYARTGKDLEFGRGDAEYDRYYADPTIKPNPCLAPIAEAPFYAMRIDPGDFGTHGGLATDEHARVLRPDGSVIDGIYAVGNCAGAILPTYPGPGATLGPAMTFAWQAAKHVSGAADDAGA